METFTHDLIVRLKNRKGKYLIAKEDKESVTKSRDGTTMNALWTVEVIDEETIYLKSCYGKYLTASNKPAVIGMTATNLKVTQTLPEKVNTSHQWSPVTQSNYGETHMVWLRTPHGSYLKASYGPSPLRGFITHDIPRKNKPNPKDKKILWQVEIVDSPSVQLRESKSLIPKMKFDPKSFGLRIAKKKKDEQNIKA